MQRSLMLIMFNEVGLYFMVSIKIDILLDYFYLGLGV